MAASLEVIGLTLIRAQRPLCQDWSFALHQGECVHLAGANGCGKTSVLQALCGLLPIETGQIAYDGHVMAHGDFSEHAAIHTQWHYCAHQNALKSIWTPRENLHWFMRLHGIAPSTQTQRITDALRALRLHAVADEPVAALSQGQKRRAALLKLYVVPRALWLLDEPFNALDEQGQTVLSQWINAHTAAGGSVLFTSHLQWPDSLAVHRTLTLNQSPTHPEVIPNMPCTHHRAKEQACH